MSINLKVEPGNSYEMTFPFHKQTLMWSPDKDVTFWVGGCRKEDGENDFIADGEGVCRYEVLSIANMPGRYQDRVIFKRTTFDPDGHLSNPGEVRVLTESKFKKHIEKGNPFPVFYCVSEE